MNADQLLDNYNELQKIELRKNLNTFTLKELKKEIIKMKADNFAVTKMKRRQIIELIVQYHYLFPHLLQNKVPKVPNENQVVLRVINKNPIYRN